MGYNKANDTFELVLVSLFSKEDTQIFIDLYSFLINSYKWEPKYINYDFALANLKAI